MYNLYKGGFLQGKKTYVTSVMSIFGAVAAYLLGEANIIQTFQLISPMVAAIFLRKGMK